MVAVLLIRAIRPLDVVSSDAVTNAAVAVKQSPVINYESVTEVNPEGE